MGSVEIDNFNELGDAVNVEELERRSGGRIGGTERDDGVEVWTGTVPVNLRGEPIVDLKGTGGWIAAFFIFGNEVTERIAYFGLAVNMVTFMFFIMHRSFSTSADIVNNFLGISQVSSVLGGFLADAYLGRYWTIAIFTTIYIAGLTVIALIGSLSVFVPNSDQCNSLSILLGTCEKAKPWQTHFLDAILYLTAIGAAGIRPCVSSFGADQFDERSKDYKAHLEKFFNFFYLSVTIGVIAAFTLVVYIQMNYGWGVAFGSIALVMGISNLLFFSGTPLYRHRLPGGSPLTRVAQVLVAAFHNRNKLFTNSEPVGLYEVPGRQSAIMGSEKIEHTNEFRFLDNAALQLNENGQESSPWRLCTVTQVEEVKILIKLLPIPACTIMLSVIFTEYLTLSVQQAYTLNTRLDKLKLPVTCMPVLPGFSILILLILYYYTFVPLARRITGHPNGASQLQRVGTGLALSVLSAVSAAVFESHRRKYAINHGFTYSFLTHMPNLSAYWLLIQYSLIGIAEVFTLVGLLEFLYEEAPDAMRSVASAYGAVAGGLGSFVATMINNIVKSVTGKNRTPWLSDNINIGRLDYFYWLLAVLGTINFCIYLYCAMKYKYREKKLSGWMMSEKKTTLEAENIKVDKMMEVAV